MDKYRNDCPLREESKTAYCFKFCVLIKTACSSIYRNLVPFFCSGKSNRKHNTILYSANICVARAVRDVLMWPNLVVRLQRKKMAAFCTYKKISNWHTAAQKSRGIFVS